MSSKIRIDLSVPVSEATFLGKTKPQDTDGRMSFMRLASYLEAIAGGPYAGRAHEVTGAVQAYGLLTVSSTGPTDGETASIANVTITAKTSGADPTAGEFDIDSDATVVAANIALAINSDDDFDGIVTATSALGVVTITAVAPGAIGNGMQLSESLTNTTATAFAHGADGHTYDYSNGY